MTREELRRSLAARRENELLDLRECRLQGMDLSGWDLRGVDLSWADCSEVSFDGADFTGSVLDNALLAGCSFRGANFRNAALKGANMRWCDLTDAHIEGADILCAVLEYAKLDGIVDDPDTKNYRLHCPETGAFLGYKKCFNDELVQLLIPADALRSSSANSACRCSRAKVLNITSFDYTQHFTEAWSLVDENFVYRLGQWVSVPDFNRDRWMESTTGIHFWMTPEEARAY